jgi:hypothetical protein
VADSAFQRQYRQETIDGFEQRQSIVRDLVTTEAVFKGNEAIFQVADSGSATATTRGTNGLIPARADNLTQNTCTLREWHDLVRKTGFNIFASQGDQNAIMQRTTMGVINRKTDDDIITELNTSSVNTGTAVPGSVALVMKAMVKLGNASIPFDGNIGALITPSLLAYLMQSTEFASADFVQTKPFDGMSMPAWQDKPGFYNWMNVKWVPHPNLPGKGTSAEKCFMFHKSAIGHAFNKDGLQTPVGYDEEQDYSWARASAYMGAKLLQGTGVVIINHDGSGNS